MTAIPGIPFLKIRPAGSILLPFILLCITSCATYKPQYGTGSLDPDGTSGEVNHTLFIAGGFGERDSEEDHKVRQLLEASIREVDSNSTLIFTGDNITPQAGDWQADSTLIDEQLHLVEKFKGRTYFLPGNNEWKGFSLDDMERSEEYLDSLNLEKVSFLPKNGCPITHEVINEELDLILIDSKWFISNWSRIKDINKKCTDIVTRRRFAEELEGYINDGQGKNIIIAMHHPIFSNGKYSGKESLDKHLLPLPVVGTFFKGVAELGAFSPDKLNSRRYSYLRVLVSALASESDRITVVSGHEENMQYLRGGDIHQIIGGSFHGRTATKRSEDQIATIGGSLEYEGKFTYGASGFTKVEYFADGSSRATFIDANDGRFAFGVLPPFREGEYEDEYPAPAKKTETDPVLEDTDALDKTGFYRFLWGERYRRYFGTSVVAPVAMLDTLYGGLKVTKEGGGHQSYSIRLEDEQGREYSMRSLRKNALKFLKFKVKGVAFTADEYEDTWAEEVISDFFTTAHPYMQLVINPLAAAIGVNHSNPVLYYIPKQEALGALNEEFGDELYFIEQRPSDEQLNYKGYKRSIDSAGEIKEFESTTDMLEKIRSDESYSVDQRDFIRARIFDMLIGDWDRHQDQWRWAEYEKADGDKEFLPVPRDRDNAFSKFDGIVMKIVKLFVPNSRRWQSYGPDIRDIKWFNIGGNKVDRALLTRYGTGTWVEEAEFIQRELSAEEIEAAFNRLPEELQDSTAHEIRRYMEARLKKLPEFARAYSQYLNRVIALRGTEKDDLIEVTRLGEGKTRVVIKRLLDDEVNEQMYERTFERDETREVWIYGLGDKDIFRVEGEGEADVLIRLIGGYGEDTYRISNSEALKVYDWRHETHHFEDMIPPKHLTDVYETNTYHWRFFEENNNILVPAFGFRTDDGLFLGASDLYTNNGFNGNPFRQQHRLQANYYFKFKALEFSYEGIFANIFPKWNFEADGYFTNNRYSTNFFGKGNETGNQEDSLGRDFYRSRMQLVKIRAGLAYHTLRFKAFYESYKSREIEGRLFLPENLGEDVFDTQQYVGGETSLHYENDDANDFPTRALYAGFAAGYKANLNISDNAFGYLSFKAGFTQKLIPSGDFVIGSVAEVKSVLGEPLFYYNLPSIGGDNGLRGFRDERFSGETYFYQTSDLRWRIKRIVTPAVPVTFGIYGGFDYGRVWAENEDSGVWHTSQGAGVWISGSNFLAFNAGFFNSVEGNTVQVGFGFGF